MLNCIEDFNYKPRSITHDSIFAAKFLKTMKNILLITACVVAVTIAGCGQNDSKADSENAAAATPENVEAKTTIEFEELAYDFGTITQGERVEHTFKFKNTGENDLLIVSAKGSCGCTIPKWPKEPIPPGGEGEIFVVFNSEGKSNKQHKKVTIVANTEPATTVLALRGEVVAPQDGTENNTSTPESTQ
ncbi:MAG: hypothetical protein Kow0075_06010 [Salibacteraceae bacterium]